MNKKIIISSVVAFVVILTTVLFAFVFRLRKQEIVAVGEISCTAEDIKNASTLKNGSSIFFLDKQQAINSIEKSIPNIKVIQIRTTSFVGVEISVRERHKTYYAEHKGQYFLMDEDLKVLGITTDAEKVTNLIKIDNTADNKILSIDENTQIATFVGGENHDILYTLYTGLYKSATKMVDGNKQYLSRQEVINLISNVTIEKGNTLNESFKRLIVKTKAGVTFDISKAEDNLEEKVNMCVSAYESGKYNISQGSIKIFYHADGTQDFDYFS